MVLPADEEPRALAGAVVRIRATPEASTAPVRRDDALTVTSDADGYFHLAQVPAFHVDLEFQAPGFAPLTLRGLPVEVPEAGATQTEADLGEVVMVPAAKIRGVVTDVEGTALAGVGVYLTRNLEQNPAYQVARLEGEGATETGADGAFVLDDLTPGERLHLIFTKAGFLSEIREGVEAPNEEDLAIGLTPATRLAGRVLDEAGAPVAEAHLTLEPFHAVPGVMAARLGPDHSHTARSDANGLSVRVDGYAPFEEDLDLTAGADVGPLRIELEPSPGVVLQVEAADGGAPPPWVQAYLVNASGEAVMIEAHRVDASGQVRLARVPEGRSRLFLSAPNAEVAQVDVEVPRFTAFGGLSPGGTVAAAGAGAGRDRQHRLGDDSRQRGPSAARRQRRDVLAAHGGQSRDRKGAGGNLERPGGLP